MHAPDQPPMALGFVMLVESTLVVLANSTIPGSTFAISTWWPNATASKPSTSSAPTMIILSSESLQRN